MSEPHELSREIAEALYEKPLKWSEANEGEHPTLYVGSMAQVIDPLVAPIIERAEKAEAENQRLRDALEAFGDEGNWYVDDSLGNIAGEAQLVWCGEGNAQSIARAALEATP